MDGNDSPLRQADDLMQRHRAMEPEPATDAPAEADDLPVLDDVFAGEGEAEKPPVVEAPAAPAVGEPAPERVAAMARELLFEHLPSQRQALAAELTAWLDDQLPHVILHVIDGLTDQIIAQLTAEARSTLLPRLQAALDENDDPPAPAG